MRHTSATIVLLGGMAIVAASGGHGPVRAQFRSGVDLVPLTVTVTNHEGLHVPDLVPADFIILEEGRPQVLSQFLSVEAPVDLAVLLDNSGSMIDDLPTAKSAACGLARRLTPGDRAEVVGVANTISVVAPMTSDLNQVEMAIRSLDAGGSTLIYEAVYVSLREFQRRNRTAAEARRQAIVLLSDGVDTSSRVAFDDLLELVRRANVVVYVIQLQRDRAARGKSGFERDPAVAMRALAHDSGGKLFTPRAATELPAMYDAIGYELRHQYLLAYVPAPLGTDGGFRRISVRVRHPAATQARTRAGYYADRRWAGR